MPVQDTFEQIEAEVKDAVEQASLSPRGRIDFFSAISDDLREKLVGLLIVICDDTREAFLARTFEEVKAKLVGKVHARIVFGPPPAACRTHDHVTD